MDALVGVRDELETKQRHFERSVGRKEKAFEELDSAISHGTAVVRGLFHLAGLSDIANRLSVRRRSQSGLEPEDELPEGARLPRTRKRRRRRRKRPSRPIPSRLTPRRPDPLRAPRCGAGAVGLAFTFR